MLSLKPSSSSRWANIFKAHNLFEYPQVLAALEELTESSIAKQCLIISKKLANAGNHSFVS